MIGARRVMIAMAVSAALLAGYATSETESLDSLPALELERLDSGTLAIAEHGEPLVLNLWATWCAPCRAELPAFDAVAARTDDIDIVGVNVGDTGGDAADLVAELGLRFDQVLDPQAELQRTLRITGMPATIFADDQGTILSIHNGELTEEELDALLAEFY